jgi:hypothetical protein
VADVVILADRREPVTYTVRLRQGWDGSLAIWVQDVADTPEDRKRVSDALRRAADRVEDSTTDV